MTTGRTHDELAGKKLVLLAGADPHRKVVKAAHELGVYVVVADYLPEDQSPAKQIADESWLVDVFDVDELERRCIAAQIDGVLNFCSDAPQVPYQKLCERLNMPCFGTEEQFKILSDKRAFRKYSKEHGLEIVSSYSVEEALSGMVEFPIFVKPSCGRGSRGQTICQAKEDVAVAIEEARSVSLDNEVVIERYMGSYQDFGSSYFIIDGEPHLIKGGDRFLGTKSEGLDRQQIMTLSPSSQIEDYIVKTDVRIKKFVKDLGISFGALFLQGFINDGEVYYYDPGLRMPGSDFDVMVKNVTGFDSMKSAVRFALTGDTTSCYGDPHNAYKLNGGRGVILSIPVRPGIIGSIEGLKELAADPRVHCISERHHVGDCIERTGDVRQRAIELVAWLPDSDGLEGFLEFVYGTLKIDDDEGNDMIICRVKCSGEHIEVV